VAKPADIRYVCVHMAFMSLTHLIFREKNQGCLVEKTGPKIGPERKLIWFLFRSTTFGKFMKKSVSPYIIAKFLK
jgi:hypothetical protein